MTWYNIKTRGKTITAIYIRYLDKKNYLHVQLLYIKMFFKSICFGSGKVVWSVIIIIFLRGIWSDFWLGGGCAVYGRDLKTFVVMISIHARLAGRKLLTLL